MANAISHSQWFLAHYRVGMKLRSLRTEKRLTLSRLAAETGLSTALLSKLETDRMTPTLTTLATICRVYGVGLGHFFCEPKEHSLSVTRKVATLGAGKNSDGESRIPLNAGVAARRMDAVLVDLLPGVAAHPPEMRSNPSLLIYVLEGCLHLETGGMLEALEAGDCAYLEGDMPACWSAGGNKRCRLLTVSSAQNAAAANPAAAEEPLATVAG